MKYFNWLLAIVIVGILGFLIKYLINKDKLTISKIEYPKNQIIGENYFEIALRIGKDTLWVPKNELIVLKPENYDSTDVLNAFHEAFGTSKKIYISKYCDECDGKVMLLKGDGIGLWQIKLHPGGGDACPNPRSPCEAGIPSLNDSSKIFAMPSHVIQKDPNLFRIDTNFKSIAILDTGIDSTDVYIKENEKYFFRDKKSRILGIDVVNSEGRLNLNDNSYVENNCAGNDHGTKVAKLIISQLNENSKIKILPIKIAEGCPGSLYDALCGLLTAKKMKADLINVSWGYKADSNIYRLTRKIFASMTNIKIIAAAGNAGVNLDIFPQYPACFSSTFSNIFTVTSVFHVPNTLINESMENYSRNYVDIGVSVDQIGSFNIPNDICYRNNGTSYATALFSGYLAGKNLITSDRETIFAGINSNTQGFCTKNYIKPPNYAIPQ